MSKRDVLKEYGEFIPHKEVLKIFTTTNESLRQWRYHKGFPKPLNVPGKPYLKSDIIEYIFRDRDPEKLEVK